MVAFRSVIVFQEKVVVCFLAQRMVWPCILILVALKLS